MAIIYQKYINSIFRFRQYVMSLDLYSTFYVGINVHKNSISLVTYQFPKINYLENKDSHWLYSSALLRN